jgi:hypothetical protein
MTLGCISYCGITAAGTAPARAASGAASLKSPPPLKFDAIGLKLQAPLGASSEGRVTFFGLLVTFFELVIIVFPLPSEFLWLKTRELPLKSPRSAAPHLC